MSLFESKFENLYLFLHNKYYREFVRLLFIYGFSPRNKPKQIKFLNYRIQVQDCLSFIFQFKEMFVKHYYMFHSNSESPLIYDCGANVGVSCLSFKKYFPNSKIKAFEADPAIAKLLKNNLNENSIMDVEVFPKAVWINENGIEFGAEGADSGSIYSDSNKMKVESIRLKDFIDGEESIELLKIDIEGAEAEVIQDCGESLGKVENIFIEYHSYLNHDQHLDRILNILTENNFRYFIRSDEQRVSPLINKKSTVNPSMDLQLVIFAYKY